MKGSRRGFVATAAGGVAGLSMASPAKNPVISAGMDYRPFGKTGAQVSLCGLGLGSVFTKALGDSPTEASLLLNRALDLGINFWDTARAYANSEELLGPVVEKRRNEIFLTSKSAVRDYDGFMRELETSLSNLKTDYLDLYYLHNLNPTAGDTISEMERGAYRALLKAKEEGIIKNIGVTGHSGAQILIDAILAFDLDAILTIFPANRPDEGRYEDVLLPLALEKELAVVAMKSIRHVRNSDLAPRELIRYSLSIPGVSTTIIGVNDIDHVESNARLVSPFKQMEPAERTQFSIKVTQNIPQGLPQPWDLPGYQDGVA